MIKKHIVYPCLLLLILCFFTGCGSDEQTTKIVLTTGLAENEVFRIENISCFQNEMMVYLTNMQNQYENVYGSQIWDTEVSGTSLEQNVKDNALAKMAQVKTMNLMAESMNITVDAAEEKKIETAGDIYYESLNSTEIDAMGVDRQLIYSLYREYLIAQKVYSEIIKDINPEVSDDEARNITIEYILVKTYLQDGSGKRIEMSQNAREAAYSKAEEAYNLAVTGGDFDELVSEYNEDEKSIVSVGKTDIEDVSYRNTLFNMANDEISPVLATEDGYIIAKILSTYDKAETDANKIKIVEKEREAVFGKEYDAYVENLTRKLNSPLWDSITFLHDDNISTSDFFVVADENL